MITVFLLVIVFALLCSNIYLYNKVERVKYDGIVQVIEDDGTKTFSFEPDGDLYDLDQRKEIRLKVQSSSVAGDRA